MFRTFSTVDGRIETTLHATYAEADAFARELRAEGVDCEVLHIIQAAPPPAPRPARPLGRIYGTGPSPHAEAWGW